MYHTLRGLLQETDPTLFLDMLEQFLLDFPADYQTLVFINYFDDHYTSNVNTWAHCHRALSGLKENVQIEHIHRTITYLYLNEKQLNKAVDKLLQFGQEKFLDKSKILDDMFLCDKVREDLLEKHSMGEELSLDLVTVTNSGWNVTSSLTASLMYQIQEIVDSCNCKLICGDCHTCIHRYSCTCLDWTVNWNMCKHIHLVCRYNYVNKVSPDKCQTERQGTPETMGNLVQTEVSNSQVLDANLQVSELQDAIEASVIKAPMVHNTSPAYPDGLQYAEVQLQIPEVDNMDDFDLETLIIIPPKGIMNEGNMQEEKDSLKNVLSGLIDSVNQLIDRASTGEELEVAKTIIANLKVNVDAILPQRETSQMHDVWNL